MIKIIKAFSQKDIKIIRQLFVEYSASLDFNLDFQNFEDEIKSLPGKYAPPYGKLYLALYKNKPAGCIAVRKIDENYCEMKRLYVRPEYRGLKIGKALSEIIINEAKRMGYKFMRLDTVASMTSARNLYREFGFKEITAYCFNPIQGAIYMELDLQVNKSIDINLQEFLECSIQFNTWKHHKGYVCTQIKSFIMQKEAGTKDLKKNLLQIGRSQMDLYTGKLTLAAIMENVSSELLNKGINNKEAYIQWLEKEGKDYRNLTLQDKSQWTLRLTKDVEKFIHIHPARYSLHTLRVRSSTLQTAVAAIVLAGIKLVSPISKNIINEARKKYLNESPVKAIYTNSGIGKIILLLSEK
jgi:putative acetyltransferase